MRTKLLIGCIATAIVLMTACSKSDPSPVAPVVPPPTNPDTPVSYLQLAKETHDFITGNLMTSSFSYRANTTTHVTNCYEWYNVSQIYADAAMVAAGESSYLPYMNNTFRFMENMWDKADARGGYFASVNLDGTGAAGDKYVDDNALSGMVFLEAYDVTSGTDKQAYLNKAKACGDWLINSGLWDNVYGGGFYWNTAKPEKPTQSNGLALQLFLRLYKITGQAVYREWAQSVDSWLTTKMYDSNSGLFIWKYDGGGAGVRHSEKFTYDNAIMVEAYLLYSQILNDASYLTKAQALGNAMNITLWNATYKGYIFNTNESRINPAWCGWGSQAMVRLYEADKNSTWLTYAKNNIDRLNIANRNAAAHAYYYFAAFDGTSRSPEIEGVDQAWMQRIQALVSKY